jgi:uncharacterized protein
MAAPAVIDSLDFARSEQHLAGELPVATLQRLHDVLVDTEGSLHYTLRGGRDERERLQLQMTIDGELHLQCQRCLECLEYPVEVVSTLLLVPRGEQVDEELDDPDAPDAIEATTELDVTQLIEDEVLLSLPLSPRHAEGACASRTAQPDDRAAASSAFSQLAALKRQGEQQ